MFEYICKTVAIEIETIEGPEEHLLLLGAHLYPFSSNQRCVLEFKETIKSSSPLQTIFMTWLILRMVVFLETLVGRALIHGEVSFSSPSLPQCIFFKEMLKSWHCIGTSCHIDLLPSSSKLSPEVSLSIDCPCLVGEHWTFLIIFWVESSAWRWLFSTVGSSWPSLHERNPLFIAQRIEPSQDGESELSGLDS